MFLNESKIVTTYDAAKTEAAYLYEAVLEANDAFHDISMKMIKCEHYCIVNEDANMLAEAEEQAKKSFKEVIANLLKKIKDALVNFKNFMMEQLTKLGKLIAKAFKSAVSGTVNLIGGIKGLKKAKKDVETIISWNSMDDMLDADFDDEVYNEASKYDGLKEKLNSSNEKIQSGVEKMGDAIDAKQAVTESKGIFEKLKAAVAKLNFFKANAEKAAREGNEQEAHKKLTAVSTKISKAFAKIRNAFKVAAAAVWGAIKATGAAIANTTKKAAGAVKSKVQKAPAEEAVAESVMPEIFLEDVIYNAEDSILSENTNIMTPVYLLYQSYTGHSMRRFAQLEDSFKKMANESDRRRLIGRIKRSISAAERALDMSNLAQFKRIMTSGTGEGLVRLVAQNLPACKKKTNEYLTKLQELEKKVEAKKFDK